jgi:hypothetical protein
MLKSCSAQQHRYRINIHGSEGKDSSNDTTTTIRTHLTSAAE